MTIRNVEAGPPDSKLVASFTVRLPEAEIDCALLDCGRGPFVRAAGVQEPDGWRFRARLSPKAAARARDLVIAALDGEQP